MTDAGREKLRKSALKNRPWRHSTGPKTIRGKKRSADNGRHRQLSPDSARSSKLQLREVRRAYKYLAARIAAEPAASDPGFPDNEAALIELFDELAKLAEGLDLGGEDPQEPT